jgi:hypothetical protein
MKKYLVAALAIALVGVSIASIAQSAPMDHSSHGMQGMQGMNPGEMQAMREAMQKKMSAAKTDEERQVLMAEQQKLMMEKRAHMMTSNGDCQGMNGIPGNMAERQELMQHRMGMMPM